MSASNLLDVLRQRFDIKSDAALARELDVVSPVISKLRGGRLPLGATMILKIHEHLGVPVAEIRALDAEQSAPQQ
jgi:plasmid maintenance system antidote protein VapI